MSGLATIRKNRGRSQSNAMLRTFDYSKIDECAKEQIHLLGRVQSHGLALVLHHKSLIIEAASENAGDLVGRNADELIGKSVSEFIGADMGDELALASEDQAYTFNNPLSVSLEIGGEPRAFDGVAHRSGEHLILELEPLSSQIAHSKDGIDNYFKLTSTTLLSIKEDDDVAQVSEKVARDVKAFTGFDRVMIYKYDHEFNGQVIAEAREEHLEAFLHLRYPASDVPPQARELYKRSWLRIISDVNDDGSPIGPVGGKTVDLSLATLRSVSPVHLQYLRNMGVSASMSISLLTPAGELWGLIACHHYSGPFKLPYRMRAACSHYALVISSRLCEREQTISEKTNASRRGELPAALRSLFGGDDLQEQIIKCSDQMMSVLQADGLAIIEKGWIRTVGDTPDRDTVEKLLELISTQNEGVEGHQSLKNLKGAADLELAQSAGVLVISVTPTWSVLAFRNEVIKEVKWGGDPSAAVTRDESGALTPRASFDTFSELVRDTCRPWTTTDIAVAQEFRSALSSFVIQRSEQLSALNSELRSKNAEIEQLAYSISHDLKSPLVTIGGYVEAMREDLESNDLEDLNFSLERIRLSSARMGNLIDDLLQFSRLGQDDQKIETVDCGELLDGLLVDFSSLFEENSITLDVREPLIPIEAKRRGVERIFENLFMNAVKHAAPKVDALTVTISSRREKGHITYEVSDDGPGIDPQFHEKIFKLFERVNAEVLGSGVGLSSVAKLMDQQGGSVFVRSNPGRQGCTFVLRFADHTN